MQIKQLSSYKRVQRGYTLYLKLIEQNEKTYFDINYLRNKLIFLFHNLNKERDLNINLDDLNKQFKFVINKLNHYLNHDNMLNNNLNNFISNFYIHNILDSFIISLNLTSSSFIYLDRFSLDHQVNYIYKLILNYVDIFKQPVFVINKILTKNERLFKFLEVGTFIYGLDTSKNLNSVRDNDVVFKLFPLHLLFESFANVLLMLNYLNSTIL